MNTWNDTDIPLAYLITFRAYGTWLHGDVRGSVNRFQNDYNTPRIAQNNGWHRHNSEKLVSEIVSFDSNQRNAVANAIREVCIHRAWELLASNVRTNHVHVVVNIGIAKPEKALNDFKAYATRKMRETGCWSIDKSPWSDKGSKRWLWNEESVFLACDYVINHQGDDLPEF
jgi:REP element-mobilizing transposase RayT